VHVFEEDEFLVPEYLHQGAQNTVLGFLQMLNVPFLEIRVVLLQGQFCQLDKHAMNKIIPLEIREVLLDD
jgi:hypothetical protein